MRRLLAGRTSLQTHNITTLRLKSAALIESTLADLDSRQQLQHSHGYAVAVLVEMVNMISGFSSKTLAFDSRQP